MNKKENPMQRIIAACWEDEDFKKRLMANPNEVLTAEGVDILVDRGKIHYLRFMDDMVILARTRWHLRKAIRILIKTIQSPHLDLHKEKRFIGRMDKGFDFLGYRIYPSRKLRPSFESLRRFRVRARRLYEQEGDISRLRRYVTRWVQWL